jgi:hypothetical protein
MRRERIPAKVKRKRFDVDDISDTNFAIHFAAVTVSSGLKFSVDPLLPYVRQLLEHGTLRRLPAVNVK